MQLPGDWVCLRRTEGLPAGGGSVEIGLGVYDPLRRTGVLLMAKRGSSGLSGTFSLLLSNGGASMECVECVDRSGLTLFHTLS